MDSKDSATLQILELESLSGPDALFVGQEHIVSFATTGNDENKRKMTYIINKLMKLEPEVNLNSRSFFSASKIDYS